MSSRRPITSISLFTEMLEDGKITEPEDQAEAFSVLSHRSRCACRSLVRIA